MTLQEKIDYISGYTDGFHLRPIKRHGIPEIRLADGPKGVQSQGVMATVKHFALNNQEYDRHHTGSDADERTMNEIYFPTFMAAVTEAQVGTTL